MRCVRSLAAVLALIAGPVAAQTSTLDDVQKAASAPLTATLDAAALGQPADDAPKVGVLASSHAADAIASVADLDKIAGNPVVLPERVKQPGLLTDGDVDLGQPPGDAPKAGELVVSAHDDARLTNYDEDKIDGNEPQPVPLGERGKAASVLEAGVDPATLGQPATDAPKTVDLAVSIATDAVPSIYDEDKITGNEPPPEPLAERQKTPGTPVDGLDAATLGTPVTDAPKTADLAVSLAADAFPNVDDNDKIVGNPYVQPPLTPRAKLASILPDPVIDADLGQPAGDGPKTALATVSLAADAVPSVDDNDKIAGNPVINPPLADRAKLPSDIDTAGLLPDELGQPTTDAVKAAVLDASRLTEAVTSTYDEDKVAGNSAYSDGDTGSYDDSSDFDPGPPPELIAQIRAMLDDEALRADVLAEAVTRVAVPDAMRDAFAGYLAALFDQTLVRDTLAVEIARPFTDFGLSPDNAGVVARMTAEQLAVFGDDVAARGIARLPVDAQRDHLADLLRIAEPLPADQCGPFLRGEMDPAAARAITLAAMADWPPVEVEATLIRQAASIVAELQDNPPRQSLSASERDRAAELTGTTLFTTLDALPNGTDLIAAYGNPAGADADDLCQVQRIILGTALETTDADGDLMVRTVIDDGGGN